jgi:hypothetical protein
MESIRLTVAQAQTRPKTVHFERYLTSEMKGLRDDKSIGTLRTYEVEAMDPCSPCADCASNIPKENSRCPYHLTATSTYAISGSKMGAKKVSGL